MITRKKPRNNSAVALSFDLPSEHRASWRRGVISMAAAALLGLSACGGVTTSAQAGGRVAEVAVPGQTVIVVPAGWRGDLASLVSADPSVTSVEVIAVGAEGDAMPVGAASLDTGGATNPGVGEASRSAGLAQLASLTIPAGTGAGDLLAGARYAFEAHQDSIRVVVTSLGCLDVAGQTLTGVDLSTPAAIAAAAAAFDDAGLLGMRGRGLLILGGLGACSIGGSERTARTALGAQLCARTQVPCKAFEAEAIR